MQQVSGRPGRGGGRSSSSPKRPASDGQGQGNEVHGDERKRTTAEEKPARNASLPHLKHLKPSEAPLCFISSLNRFRFMPAHVCAVRGVQETHGSEGDLAAGSLNPLCRQMARKQAGRESASKEDDVLQEKLRDVNGTVAARKDKLLQSISRAQSKQQGNDLEEDCDHLQFLKVKGVILVIP